MDRSSDRGHLYTFLLSLKPNKLFALKHRLASDLSERCRQTKGGLDQRKSSAAQWKGGD